MSSVQPGAERRAVEIGVIIGAGVVAAFQVGKAPIAIPLLRAELGLTLTEVSWVLSLFAVLGTCLAVVIGLIAPKLGAKRAVVAALAMIALGSFIGSFASSFSLLVTTRAVEGAGLILIATCAPALIAGLTQSHNKATILAVWGIYMPMGMSIMIALGIGLPDFGWRAMWLGNAVVASLWCVLCLLLIPPDQASGPLNWTTLRNDIRAILSAGPGLRLAAAFFVYGLIYYAFLGLLPTMLLDRFHAPLALVALASAAVVFCNTLGNLSVSLMVRAGASPWILITSAFAIISLPAVVIFSQGVPLEYVLVASGLLIGVGGVIPASTMAAAGSLAPSPMLVAAMFGLITQASAMGQLVGPAVFARWVVWLGWESGLFFVIPLALIGALLAASLRFTFSSRGTRSTEAIVPQEAPTS